MPYLTQCPNCQGDLFLTKCVVCTNVPIYADGFDLSEASINTEDEIVTCDDCGYEGPLQFTERANSLSSAPQT